MINGLGTPYNPMVANMALNEARIQNDAKANAGAQKTPDKLDAIKEAVSKGEYKLDMTKTAGALAQHYA